jgi:hypothetical protein
MSVRSEIAAARSQSHNALMNAIAASPDLETTFKRWWLQADQTAERKPPAVRLVSVQARRALIQIDGGSRQLARRARPVIARANGCRIAAPALAYC